MVNLLDIDKAKSDQKSISEEVNETVMEHILAGIEIISGRARGSHYLNQVMERLDERYLMKWFCTNNANYNSITRVYEDLSVADHLCNLYGPSIISEEGNTDVMLRHVPESEEDSFVGGVLRASRQNVAARNNYASSFCGGGELHGIYGSAKEGDDRNDSDNGPNNSPIPPP